MTDSSSGGPVAVVAGASRGLGLLVARELTRRGVRVHGCARDGDELHRARARIDADGAAEFVPHVCDVRDPEAVADLVDAVVFRDGRLDVAVHVAGVIQVAPVESLTLGHFREALDTMLVGPIHLCLAVLPWMRAAGHGRIGVVTSIGGVVAVPQLIPYSAAKFGAVGLGQGLYAGLSGSGVTVTTVVPGLMRTGGHVAAEFAGNAHADYSSFAPAASLPLVSISADRAARRLVDGVLRGRPVVELGALATVARIAHGVAPATTVRLLGLAGRALPGGPDRGLPLAEHDAPAQPGRAARRGQGRLVAALSLLGTRAARRNNEAT